MITVKFAFKALIIKDETPNHSKSAEIIFGPTTGATIGVRMYETGVNGRQELTYSLELPDTNHEAQGIIHDAITEFARNTIRAATDGHLETEELEIKFEKEGLMLVSRDVGQPIGAIVFDRAELSGAGEPCWATAIAAKGLAQDPAVPTMKPVSSWEDAQAFFALHGITVALGDPAHPDNKASDFRMS